jgi:hypothetical protein
LVHATLVFARSRENIGVMIAQPAAAQAHDDPYDGLKASLRQAVRVCARTTPTVLAADDSHANITSSEPCARPCWKELRARVVMLATALRNANVGGEQILSEIRSVIRSAQPDVDSGSAMMAAVVAWCIEGCCSCSLERPLSKPNA